MTRRTVALLALVGFLMAPAAFGMNRFKDIKLFYEPPGKTKVEKKDGDLFLDPLQRVGVFLNNDKEPIWTVSAANVTGMEFDEKNDKTLTIRFESAGGGKFVRMELGGKWKDVLDAIRSQWGKSIELVTKK